MSLAPGTAIGPYEVVSLIGVGGMGEVYRATDKNLGRAVAIKILPDEFSRISERLARFEREARTLASLNHPNIATIHGFEKNDGIRALVMEFVDGPTLADRLDAGTHSTSKKRCPSRDRSRKRSNRPTSKVSFIVISSPQISSCAPMAP